jgi:hypothetical protein
MGGEGNDSQLNRLYVQICTRYTVDILRSPLEINSEPGGIGCLELIPGLQTLLQIRALNPSFDQWGRRLERWPNSEARLVGWKRVTYLTGAAQLQADEISNCWYIINVHNHPSWATSLKKGMAWYSSTYSRPMLSLWVGHTQMLA